MNVEVQADGGVVVGAFDAVLVDDVVGQDAADGHVSVQAVFKTHAHLGAVAGHVAFNASACINQGVVDDFAGFEGHTSHDASRRFLVVVGKTFDAHQHVVVHDVVTQDDGRVDGLGGGVQGWARHGGTVAAQLHAFVIAQKVFGVALRECGACGQGHQGQKCSDFHVDAWMGCAFKKIWKSRSVRS